MKWYKSLSLVFLIIIITLNGCSLRSNRKNQKLIDINKQHLDVPIPYQEFADYLYDPSELDDAFEMKFEAKGIRNYLSKEEAIEEINDLFKQLAYNYGMFAYYGKEVFDKAQKQCIDEISEISDRVEVSELRKIYIRNLSFIEDQHFRVDGFSLHAEIPTYYSEELWFGKDANGYYLLPMKKYVNQIESEGDLSLESNIKPVLNDEGEVYYQFVHIGEVPDKLSLILENDEKVTVNMTKYQNNNKSSCSIFEFKTINGIPYLCIMEMRELEMPMMQDFIETSKKVGKIDKMIIDLRNSQGGNSEIVESWMKGAFGKRSGNSLEIFRIGILKHFYENEIRDRLLNYGYKFIDQNHFVNIPNKEMLSNQTTIVVLMNRGTSSAAERFIDYLHNVENVVFVGVNSKGIFISDAAYTIYSKYSNIKFVYGNGVKIFDESYFREYVGFEPDIYYFGERKIEDLIFQYLNK